MFSIWAYSSNTSAVQDYLNFFRFLQWQVHAFFVLFLGENFLPRSFPIFLSFLTIVAEEFKTDISQNKLLQL